ncbi:SH3 domain protein [Onchocerca flexuosa]|uniref:SH3 domain protein n=2 Tax=Onchocerca flexuosa TaxID=387005 RepID=A0A238BX79_9BILA|nr:SH3 domain protein [Onchocerca flexuosa]
MRETSLSSSFDPYSWRNFYFHVDREEATRLLCQPDSDLGTFLIRDSTAPGSYALSVREELSGDQQVRHYLIEPVEADNGKTNVKIADQFFVDIPALLNHFKMRILANVSLMIALYSFEGQEPTDLSFEKNEILDIIEKPQEEWWEARNALGNVGLVPGNYLAQFDEILMQRDSPESSLSSENRLSGASVLSDANDDMLNNTQLSETTHIPTLARVILDRRPNVYDTEALRLKKGDLLKVTRLHPSGICEGILNGKKGTFPFTYVEFVDDVDTAATPTPV